jgi:hypothetical protein
MQNHKIQPLTPLILAPLLALLACPITETQPKKAEVSLKALSQPQGICLTFNNIPTNTVWVYVQYNDWDGKDAPDNYYHGTSNYAFIQETPAIKRLKETNTLILPFVQAGHKYKIYATFFLTKEGETQTQDNKPISLETECIAGNGTYIEETVNLNLADTLTGITLSSAPQFSSNVQLAPTETTYKLTLLYSGTGTQFATISIGDKIAKNTLSPNGLTWEFESDMSNYLKEGSQIKNSVNYPAYFTAYSNLIYNDITWSIKIEKSREFTYSLFDK